MTVKIKAKCLAVINFSFSYLFFDYDLLLFRLSFFNSQKDPWI